MDTNGGGWTLVWSYSFTNCSHFRDDSNAISLIPNLPATNKVFSYLHNSSVRWNRPIFRLWKQLGRQILIKSSINNWLVCHPVTGSLVDLQKGNVNFRITKYVHYVADPSKSSSAPSKFYQAPTMDQCSIRVGAGTAPFIISIVTQAKIGLPLILVEEIGSTKRKTFLIQTVTFLYEPSSRQTITNLYTRISQS